MVSDRTMNRIERLLVLMIEKDRRELRRQRQETKRLRALFEQNEEEFARQMEQSRARTRQLLSKLKRDDPFKDGTEGDLPK